MLELSYRVIAAPGEQETLEVFPQSFDRVEMRSIGRQVTQEQVLFFPALSLFFDVGAGMETGIVQDHDAQSVWRSVTSEFVDEGEHMLALDVFLKQLDVQGALLLAPSERAD